MIADKMKNMVANSSAIRAMFEEGTRLAGIYGRENVFDFSLGNPNVPAPQIVKDAIVELVNDTDPVVLHPVPNNGEDIALHAPTPGRLLALVGQRGFSSTPLVVWNKGFPVVVEVGKQLPLLLLFVGIQCALNRCLHHSNRFFDFTCMK